MLKLSCECGSWNSISAVVVENVRWIGMLRGSSCVCLYAPVEYFQESIYDNLVRSGAAVYPQMNHGHVFWSLICDFEWVKFCLTLVSGLSSGGLFVLE